jgi:hypothetical protein
VQGLRWLIAGGEGLYCDFDALLLCIQHPLPDRGQEIDEYHTQWAALEDAIGGIEKTGQTPHYFKAPCESAIHAREGPVCAQIHPLRQCNMQYNGLWD